MFLYLAIAISSLNATVWKVYSETYHLIIDTMYFFIAYDNKMINLLENLLHLYSLSIYFVL